MARLEGRFVRGDHRLASGELLLDPVEGGIRRPGVEPRDQPEGEEVLRPFRVAGFHVEVLAHLLGQFGHRCGDDGVAVEGAVLERVRLVARLGQIPLFERVGVDDHRAAGLELRQVALHRGRIHRHQHVGRVAVGGDVVIGDVDLERGHAGQRPGRGTDLGGELGQRREVVAEQGTCRGEAIPRQLHAVAGVAREPHDDAVDLAHFRRPVIDVGHVAPWVACRSGDHGGSP